eukprot:COSAG05_NODE_512_length_9090_cov_33.937827_5_plen_45_part_00
MTLGQVQALVVTKPAKRAHSKRALASRDFGAFEGDSIRMGLFVG